MRSFVNPFTNLPASLRKYLHDRDKYLRSGIIVAVQPARVTESFHSRSASPSAFAQSPMMRRWTAGRVSPRRGPTHREEKLDDGAPRITCGSGNADPGPPPRSSEKRALSRLRARCLRNDGTERHRQPRSITRLDEETWRDRVRGYIPPCPDKPPGFTGGRPRATASPRERYRERRVNVHKGIREHSAAITIGDTRVSLSAPRLECMRARTWVYMCVCIYIHVCTYALIGNIRAPGSLSILTRARPPRRWFCPVSRGSVASAGRRPSSRYDLIRRAYARVRACLSRGVSRNLFIIARRLSVDCSKITAVRQHVFFFRARKREREGRKDENVVTLFAIYPRPLLCHFAAAVGNRVDENENCRSRVCTEHAKSNHAKKRDALLRFLKSSWQMKSDAEV